MKKKCESEQKKKKKKKKKTSSCHEGPRSTAHSPYATDADTDHCRRISSLFFEELTWSELDTDSLAARWALRTRAGTATFARHNVDDANWICQILADWLAEDRESTKWVVPGARKRWLLANAAKCQRKAARALNWTIEDLRAHRSL